MSFSDPSLTPLGTTAATPKQQAQVKEVIMNSSMMYMHEVRTFHPEVSVTKKKKTVVRKYFCLKYVQLYPSV